MTATLIKVLILLAVFASVFMISELVARLAWQRRAQFAAINKRITLIKRGNSRESVVATLRKNDPSQFNFLPGPLAAAAQKILRSLMMAAIPVTPSQLLIGVIAAVALVMAILLIGAKLAGFALSFGILVMCTIFALCVAAALPLMIINIVGHKRRRKIEDQFPVALDIFVRALRSGHPIASAIDLLTQEMEDPIGSEFGLVSDEVVYGAELKDALDAMGERWDLDDMRMFVVCLSVQSETGGNLAEILQNLSTVIRERASLYRKVRALSSEGRMTGWMLSILPVAAFVGLFLVNPQFYLSVAGDPAFVIGAIGLLLLYVLGIVMIRSIVNLEV